MENSSDKHWRFDQVRTSFYLWPYFILCWAAVCVNSIRTLSCTLLLGTHLLLLPVRVSSGKCNKPFPILLLSCSISLLVAWSTVLGHTHFPSCHLFYLSFGRVKPGLCSEATEGPRCWLAGLWHFLLAVNWLYFTLQTSMSIFKPETVVSIAGLANPIIDFFLTEARMFFLIFHLILDENGPSLEIVTDVFLYQKSQTIYRRKPKLREQNILLFGLVSCFCYMSFSSACCSFTVWSISSFLCFCSILNKNWSYYYIA